MSLDRNLKIKKEDRPENTLLIGYGKVDCLKKTIKKDVLENNSQIIVFEMYEELSYSLKKEIDFEDNNIINLNFSDSNFYVNILDGKEEDVIREFKDAFKNSYIYNHTYAYRDKSELQNALVLLEHSIKLLKKTYGKKANILKLNNMVSSSYTCKEILNLYLKSNKEKKDLDLADWFYNVHFKKDYRYEALENFIRQTENGYYRIFDYYLSNKKKKYLNLEEVIKNGASLFINVGLEKGKYNEDYIYVSSVLWEKVRTIILNRKIEKDNKYINVYINEAESYFNPNLIKDIRSDLYKDNNVKLILGMRTIFFHDIWVNYHYKVNRKLWDNRRVICNCFRDIVVFPNSKSVDFMYFDEYIYENKINSLINKIKRLTY